VRGLFLVRAKRAELALRGEQFLHGRRPHGAGQLVLEVDVACVETKRLEVGAAEARAEASSLELAPEVALLRGVVEARETEAEPRGPVPLEEAADVSLAADRDDRDAFRIEVAAPSLGERPNNCPVAGSLYEHDRAKLRVGHSTQSLWRGRGNQDELSGEARGDVLRLRGRKA
jgi:hypothetical protein